MKDQKTHGGERSPTVSESGTTVDLARLDLWREEKAGIPEVILGAGKRPGDVIRLLKTLAMKKGIAMATKTSDRCLWIAGCENDPDLHLEAYTRAKVIVARKKEHPFPQPQGYSKAIF